mmetsp:Transcript_92100/g.287123  ORF Transcript_92100/g.287123 Transcript_92100/m.287123 type:complete len:311 (+) Transcript_92100:101-1033(+)
MAAASRLMFKHSPLYGLGMPKPLHADDHAVLRLDWMRLAPPKQGERSLRNISTFRGELQVEADGFALGGPLCHHRLQQPRVCCGRSRLGPAHLALHGVGRDGGREQRRSPEDQVAELLKVNLPVAVEIILWQEDRYIRWRIRGDAGDLEHADLPAAVRVEDPESGVDRLVRAHLAEVVGGREVLRVLDLVGTICIHGVEDVLHPLRNVAGCSWAVAGDGVGQLRPADAAVPVLVHGEELLVEVGDVLVGQLHGQGCEEGAAEHVAPVEAGECVHGLVQPIRRGHGPGLCAQPCASRCCGCGQPPVWRSAQ